MELLTGLCVISPDNALKSPGKGYTGPSLCDFHHLNLFSCVPEDETEHLLEIPLRLDLMSKNI